VVTLQSIQFLRCDVLLSGRSFVVFRRKTLLPPSRLKLRVQPARSKQKTKLCFAYSSTMMLERYITFLQNLCELLADCAMSHVKKMALLCIVFHVVLCGQYYHLTLKTDPVPETVLCSFPVPDAGQSPEHPVILTLQFLLTYLLTELSPS
jgi:hypothetical protein